MRFLVKIFIMCVYISSAVGAELGAELDNVLYTPLAGRSGAVNTTMSLNSEMADIEREISALNPELVKKMAGKDDFEKLIAYKNYLANAVIDWYIDYFSQCLDERSKQTGRAIKKDKYTRKEKNGNTEVANYYFLDRGHLDDPKCELKDKPVCNSAYSECTINMANICPYPDGYEEVMLVIEKDCSNDDCTGEGMHGMEVGFIEDNKEKDTSISARIEVHIDKDKELYQEIGIDFSGDEASYKKYAQYRELMRQVEFDKYEIEKSTMSDAEKLEKLEILNNYSVRKQEEIDIEHKIQGITIDSTDMLRKWRSIIK